MTGDPEIPNEGDHDPDQIEQCQAFVAESLAMTLDQKFDELAESYGLGYWDVCEAIRKAAVEIAVSYTLPGEGRQADWDELERYVDNLLVGTQQAAFQRVDVEDLLDQPGMITIAGLAYDRIRYGSEGPEWALSGAAYQCQKWAASKGELHLANCPAERARLQQATRWL